MNEKLIVRVLAAVEAGYETPAAIALHVQASIGAVRSLLGLLVASGQISATPFHQRRRGRPTCRYRISHPISRDSAAI